MPKADKPLNPRSSNASLNSRLHAATENQSSVTPEDYPREKRREQVAAGTGDRRAVEPGFPKAKPE